ncbi:MULTISPECIES: NUDIX hydrolase [unclassified Arthrobacter]|uniref:NUDIX hydrolase n=1 Tax=unclassified Arthrobacter TaxID=235627 RepID=UPI001D15A5B1|nr:MULTISPECIES: NUDIX domain-containing protein [unclassified Arthrobacter]MCC3274986.1 NUDIX hydrolase [Arthrobacter sp. zg-Y20]MCC9177417.1 NUDIX hydrolase [Arthrobacter sp. zg-Y750]MDK1315143.1 NUDIX domain-containing protein [Arthrobacter sp. zg.Y20]WIB04985.1 NUDIX domain-containing protein [Arthrobacter sp. zg-Y20]
MDTEEERFLKDYTPREYPSVALAVDLVVFAVTGGTLNAAFVRRGAHPFKGSLALPGGFVSPDEDALTAAWRELQEETGLELGAHRAHVEQLATFSAPARDPRMRVVSVAHLALLATDGRALPDLATGSDAASAQWLPVYDVLARECLAFDHREILTAALDRLAGKIEYTLTAARLLPEEFTLNQLRRAYQAVWNTNKLDAGNFTRKMTGALQDTGRKVTRGKGAPATVFTVKDEYLSPPLIRPAA